MFQQILRSIFPEPLLPRTETQRKRFPLKNLVLHFRPATVPQKTMRFSLTWGLGGMAATLILAVGVGFLRQSPETPLRVEIADAQLEELLAEAEALMADDSIPGLWVADPVTDVDELENLFANGAS